MTSLVIEIEVLALSFTFSAYHFGNGCPVSPVLDKPWSKTRTRKSSNENVWPTINLVFFFTYYTLLQSLHN